MKNLLTSARESRFNELLFENRNKNYGAYVLRNEEGIIMQKSLLIGVALFAALSIAPVLYNALTSKDEVVKTATPGHILHQIVETPDITPPAAVPVVPPKKPESTVKIEIPTPTKNPPVETPPASVTQIKETKIGHENVVGEPSTTNYIPHVTVQGPAAAPVTVPPKAANNDPVSVVDVPANFAGGINAFRSKVVQSFGTDSFEGSGDLMKTTVTFIVEKDGTISNIKANGMDSRFNVEAEKTIKKIKGNWTPAKLNGENVRSYFKFPITMQFE